MAVLDSTYLSMHAKLFDDFTDLLPGYSCKEAAADKNYLIQRSLKEGTAFVMKTLPLLGKALERALEKGSFDPVPSFKREHGRTTPAFMRALFKGVFNDTGQLSETPSAECIRGIRQVAYFQYKLEVDHDKSVQDKFVSEFVETDDSLTHCDKVDREQALILKVAQTVVNNIFRDLDHRSIIPRPGPGASAQGTHRSVRFEPLVKYQAIHEVYPYYDYFYMDTKHLLDRLRAYKHLPVETAGASVVRLVPKDARGPRIICMEPQEYMFLQQGLADSMRNCIESHPLSRGRVNFKSQEVNRIMALESSIGRRYATLDMKEASDRISRKLVEQMFSGIPNMQRALLALSTPRTILPSGVERNHRKFAPMGSSLCFPTMSIVHYALGLAILHIQTCIPIKALAKDCIYVYGDDIIVKTEYVDHLFRNFPIFGLMFNEGKSFKDGHFRESCGMDAYQGVCVTPLRLKKRFLDIPPGSKKISIEKFSAAADFAYNLKRRGYTKTAALVKQVITDRHGSFPTVLRGSNILGWITDDPNRIDVANLRLAYHKPTHSYRLRARVVQRLSDSSMVGGWERLMKSVLLSPEDTARVEDRNSRLKWRDAWVPVQNAYGPVKSIALALGT